MPCKNVSLGKCKNEDPDQPVQSDQGLHCLLTESLDNISRVERKTSNSNIFLKPLFKDNFDPFVNNANLGAIAHTSNGT